MFVHEIFALVIYCFSAQPELYPWRIMLYSPLFTYFSFSFHLVFFSMYPFFSANWHIATSKFKADSYDCIVAWQKVASKPPRKILAETKSIGQ